MAKTSVLQRPKVDVNSGRHDFDRSYTSNMNQSHGELRCVFLEPCVAGTKGVINAKMFTRTKKVVFPAFQTVDQHIEFFKVPLRYLWSKWNDWKLNINDINSSALVPYTSSPAPAPDLHMNVGCPRLNIGNQGSQSLITRMGLLTGADKVQVYKMLDDMNLGGYLNGLDTDNKVGACMINLFGLAAYQKVYYDHFRNSTYESNNPYAYNLDWLQSPSSSSENVLEPSDGTKEAWVTKELFTIRYKNYRNDFYHNLYPSLNYSQSQPTGTDWVLPNSLQGVANLINPGDLSSFNSSYDISRWNTGNNDSAIANSVGNLASGLTVNTSSGATSFFHDHVVNDASQLTNRASINVQQIRAMFALDKLMRASAYAPKHVKQQFEARYGVKMSDKVSFESERLGSFMNSIVFGEVTATSDTYQSSGGTSTGQQLGAISGKGVGFRGFGNDINFYCEEDSIIIGIQYFLARANYDNTGLDDWAMKLTRNDFFIREYEHLGLRPMYLKHLNYTGSSSADNNILGFQEANMRYKVGIDRNHGLFNVNYLNYATGSGVSSQSELSAFIVHTNLTPFLGVSGGVDYRYFKAYPSHLDYIFEQNYDSKNMSTDQFYGQTHFKFYVNAPMDVHSQPYM